MVDTESEWTCEDADSEGGDDPEPGDDPDPDAPVAGDIGFSNGKVTIRVDNAKAGVRYGYRFAERLQDVDKAEIIWLDGAAAADGVLTLDVDRATSTGFFRLVAE